MISFRTFLAQAAVTGDRIIITPMVNEFGVIEFAAEHEREPIREFHGMSHDFGGRHVVPIFRRDAHGIRGSKEHPLDPDRLKANVTGRPVEEGC